MSHDLELLHCDHNEVLKLLYYLQNTLKFKSLDSLVGKAWAKLVIVFLEAWILVLNTILDFMHYHLLNSVLEAEAYCSPT